MKKLLIFLLSPLIMVGVLAGCSSDKDISNSNNAVNKKLSIVMTIFPQYDWVKQILGTHADEVDLTLLLDNGVDMHSYQPTVDDIIKISESDIFIYSGGESDSWVEEILKTAKNKDMTTINLLDIIGEDAKTEEIIEGMQEEAEEDDHNHDHNHENGQIEYDEHVWLSLKNAVTLCNYISDKLCQVDADNAKDYITNAENYVLQLTALGDEYQQMVDSSQRKTVLFGDRFPFRYLIDDYGLNYYAAFVGCSAETEASFETIAFLSQKVDELKLTTVLTIEATQHKIAETIIANTTDKNQQIVEMDSMQSTTLEDAEAGTTYLSLMEANLDALRTALK